MKTQPTSTEHGPQVVSSDGSADPLYFCIEWNAENELKRVLKNGSEQARFAYDPISRRVEKVAGGTTIGWTFDGAGILREIKGAVTLKYINGLDIDEPLATDDGSTLSYYHADALGSVTKTTSSGGSVTLTRRHDAWGNVELGSTTSGYAFTGREHEAETGLAYYRFRYYDPRLGRFVSEDPVGFVGGKNFYRYVNNRPADFRDPLGLRECQVDNCLQGCLENLFGEKIPNVNVSTGSKTTFFMKFIGKGGNAISHPNSIRVPQGTSCYDFMHNFWWVAHEYYHVVRQWRATGAFRLTKKKYVSDPDRWETPANNFANEMWPTLERCWVDCATCPVPN